MQTLGLDFNNRLILCLCEGNAEIDIMNMLLDNDMLIFDRSMLFEGKVCKRESVEMIQEKYLSLSFKDKKLVILRIIDSKHEAFRLSKPYNEMYKSMIFTCITSPEIEILIIHKEGGIVDFKKCKSYTKPSGFCKEHYGFKKIKNKGFMNEYFNDPNGLLEAIVEYEKNSQRKELSLYDLLKLEYKFD